MNMSEQVIRPSMSKGGFVWAMFSFLSKQRAFIFGFLGLVTVVNFALASRTLFFQSTHAVPKLVATLDNSSALNSLPELNLKDVAQYEQAVAQRNIFQFEQPIDNPEASLSNGPMGTSSILAELENLQLKGIILDEVPQAIVKDPLTNNSLFLQEGDAINGATVTNIQAEQVVLNYEGTTIALKLKQALHE